MARGIRMLCVWFCVSVYQGFSSCHLLIQKRLPWRLLDSSVTQLVTVAGTVPGLVTSTFCSWVELASNFNVSDLWLKLCAAFLCLQSRQCSLRGKMCVQPNIALWLRQKMCSVAQPCDSLTLAEYSHAVAALYRSGCRSVPMSIQLQLLSSLLHPQLVLVCPCPAAFKFQSLLRFGALDSN